MLTRYEAERIRIQRLSSWSTSDKMANVVGVDVGSTTISCFVFDENCNVKGNSMLGVHLEHPKPGYTEIDPEKLWSQFLSVINGALDSAGITAKDITSLGISVQRGSFITWDRNTGEVLHNFIGWQDLRASKITDDWNSSLTINSIKFASKVLYAFTGKNRFKAASVITFSPYHASMRLYWMLKNNPTVYRKAHNGTLLFGTIDSWLLWKLSKGKLHVTDYSNASSTGIFDPYMMTWSTVFCSILELPLSIFPSFIDTSGFIVDVDESIFGHSFPIHALAADQQAAVFGQCCFNEGDINCTLGTGTFIDINTGLNPHASIGGLYPVVGWKIKEETVFIAEGNTQGTSSSVELLKNLGLFDDVSLTADMANEVENSDGVYFIPAFNGLQAPINDNHAVPLLIGMNIDTSRQHIVRAVLESIAFRFHQLYQIVISEIQVPVKSSIKADGGVARNDFVVKLIASLTKHETDRAAFSDMSALGAAFFAGLGAGVWKSKEELLDLRVSGKTFQPDLDMGKSYVSTLKTWEKAMERSLGWYKGKY
ncbi:putative glycerol kinase 5 isoform X2 [Rhopilema esculentum]|uniref:putative glycerol kinase 5 isoform X2 n=1 Tax=Rhopilema esculentum TaxID=499914 RepID=UPI0031D3C318